MGRIFHLYHFPVVQPELGNRNRRSHTCGNLQEGPSILEEGILETKGRGGLKYLRLGQATLSVLTRSAHQHTFIYGEYTGSSWQDSSIGP